MFDRLSARYIVIFSDVLKDIKSYTYYRLPADGGIWSYEKAFEPMNCHRCGEYVIDNVPAKIKCKCILLSFADKLKMVFDIIKSENEKRKLEADYKFFDYLKYPATATGMNEYEAEELNWPTHQVPKLVPDRYWYEGEELNWPVSTLVPDTYWHEGECIPSKSKCQSCYKYWCGKCGNGVSNYMSGCCTNVV